MFSYKIKNADELASIIEDLKKDGKKVAQCHGCFDLVHLGHVKHLEAAKRMADVLVISVTADKFINKGPGRPIYNEQLRMENLASLECVDYVCLDDNPDAIDILKRLKPSYYIKGEDYKDFDADVTGKIRLEKEAVESVGGEIRFTEEITFSSTQLINRHFQFLPDAVQQYLTGLRSKYFSEQIVPYIEQFNDLRVLVVGDAIIDEYCFCEVLGTASKYPNLSTIYQSSLEMCGGSLALARHAASFANVHLVTIIGEHESHEDLITNVLQDSGIEYKLFRHEEASTILKRRFISHGYPSPLIGLFSSSHNYVNAAGTRLFQINYLFNKPISKALETQIIDYLQSVLPDYDMVIIGDFGHGVITPQIAMFISENANWWAINAQTNSANFGFNFITKYHNSNYVCIDELEARLPFGDKNCNVDEVAKKLQRALGCEGLMITRGKDGLRLYNNEIFDAPALERAPTDATGAGDAVLGISSLCAYKSLPAEITVFLSACTGALACNIIGNEKPITKPMLLKYIGGILK